MRHRHRRPWLEKLRESTIQSSAAAAAVTRNVPSYSYMVSLAAKRYISSGTVTKVFYLPYFMGNTVRYKFEGKKCQKTSSDVTTSTNRRAEESESARRVLNATHLLLKHVFYCGVLNLKRSKNRYDKTHNRTVPLDHELLGRTRESTDDLRHGRYSYPR